ncbi:relaxase/mobilization nuclease domain-containing protein [Rufibacter sediminis]|uniref:MobA/VirD2-like nuclease domain-containing protein n=1 Tax=Rufibacter sediminis TaxID=2762756 RepID=A0ABR6VTV4_9BACT|nr:hypothetical protein [Rufibacter sediminis]MBC3540613.1 hypothetical protein [Rufibacter sediminis]
MIIKGNLHSDADGLADYMLGVGDNDKVRIFANEGGIFTKLTAQDFRMTMKEMGHLADQTKAKYPAYHIQLCPDHDAAKNLKDRDIKYMINEVLHQRGLSGRPYTCAIHYKHGLPHIHLGVQRYNPETGKMDPNKKWARDHDRARANIEKALGHKRTPLRNIYREQIKKAVNYVWQASGNAVELLKGIRDLGYMIAKGGHKRPWQLVDDRGIAHNLVKMLFPVKAKELSDKLKGQKLPMYDEAIKEQREKFKQKEQAKKEEARQQFTGYGRDDRKPDTRQHFADFGQNDRDAEAAQIERDIKEGRERGRGFQKEPE